MEIQELENKIKELKKENEELKKDNKMLNEMVCLGGKIPFLYTTPKFTTNENFISKDKIREILGLEENISNEKILDYIELLVEENNRLEDIEDRKVEVEYKNVFNKGVISVKDKIRNEIKELENILEKRKTIDIIEEINRLEELLKESDIE